ncbi:MAG: hypothetical protein IPM98_06520 [Lewinellaceae bacterium]|nr:hypothetical protein [Lewinellaceae bacterium]
MAKQIWCPKVMEARSFEIRKKNSYMKNKGRWILLGLLLVLVGITAMILQLVGAQWVFLQFLEIPGRLFAFVAKILMVMAGFIIISLANTDWEKDRKESQAK